MCQFFSCTTSYTGNLQQFVLEVCSNFVFGICPIGKVELTICIRTRPAKSGKWRECYLQQFLSSAEICLHKHKKKMNICFFFYNFRIFWKFVTLWKSCSENYNKRIYSFHLIPAEFISFGKSFDSAEVFPHIVIHKGHIWISKKQVSFVIKRNISSDASLQKISDF